MNGGPSTNRMVGCLAPLLLLQLSSAAPATLDVPLVPLLYSGGKQLGNRSIQLDFFEYPQHVFEPVVVRAYDYQLDDLNSGLDSKWWTMQDITRTTLKNVERERQKLQKRRRYKRQASKNWKSFDVNRYHDFYEISDWLRAVASQYKAYNGKDIVELYTPGYSVQSKPILVLKIGAKKSSLKPAILIDGGIHAREWGSPASVLHMIDKLLRGYNNDDQNVRNLIENVDFYLAPVMNPDGYQYSHTNDRFWRKNRRAGTTSTRWGQKCHGVDLNRNFAFNYGGIDASRDPCAANYRGTHSMSEPEAKALQKFITSKQPTIKAYVTLHTYGNMWFVPFGDRRNHYARNYHEQFAVAKAAEDAIKRETGTRYKVGSSASILYPAAGTSDDWAHGTMNIPWSFGVEVGPTRTGFDPPERHLNGIGREMYAAVEQVALKLRQKRYFRRQRLQRQRNQRQTRT